MALFYQNGVHVLKDERGMVSAEMRMLIKTQDLTYAVLAQSKEKKARVLQNTAGHRLNRGGAWFGLTHLGGQPVRNRLTQKCRRLNNIGVY